MCLAYPRPMPMAMARRGGGMVMFAAAPNMVMEKSVRGPPPAKTELAPVKRVRKLFPETWLWKSVDTSYVVCTLCIVLACLVPVLCVLCNGVQCFGLKGEIVRSAHRGWYTVYIGIDAHIEICLNKIYSPLIQLLFFC